MESRLNTHIEILKKDIILNLNDAKARGWSRTIKNLVKNYDNRFLLKLVNGADVDMLNIYNHHNDFINPRMAKNNIGNMYFESMQNWNCNFALPFSCFHKYIRKDTLKMNEFITPLKDHFEGFNSSIGNYCLHY